MVCSNAMALECLIGTKASRDGKGLFVCSFVWVNRHTANHAEKLRTYTSDA